MSIQLNNSSRSAQFEWITPQGLIANAVNVMGGIDLDPASSKFANEYVGADNFFTPSDDPLNSAKWFGNVYLFPPSNTYFWHAKTMRWKATRGLSKTLTSGMALWWRTLKRKWMQGEVRQAIYFTNQADMIMYCQDIFDHPVCIFNSRPFLTRHYFVDDAIENKSTGTSLVVYLHPKENIEESTELFVETYKERGRILL
jgi:hypothetical protein